MKKNFEENEFEMLAAFSKLIKKDSVKMIDYSRYETMLVSALKLEKILAKTQESGEINVDVNEMFNIGSVSVELPDLLIENTKEFTEIISDANNFEVYPLANGKIRLDITFQAVLKTIE